jgi:hypothetical protein
VEELGLPHSKIRVLPPPLGRPRERRSVVAEVASVGLDRQKTRRVGQTSRGFGSCQIS